jgi:hypothetical protein
VTISPLHPLNAIVLQDVLRIIIAELLSLQKIVVSLSMAVYHAMILPRLFIMVPKILGLLQALLINFSLVHLWLLPHPSMVSNILGLLQVLSTSINFNHIWPLLLKLSL